jgi:hypothetical protein
MVHFGHCGPFHLYMAAELLLVHHHHHRSFASSKAVSRGRSSSGRLLLVTGNDDDDDDNDASAAAELLVLFLQRALFFHLVLCGKKSHPRFFLRFHHRVHRTAAAGVAPLFPTSSHDDPHDDQEATTIAGCVSRESPAYLVRRTMFISPYAH